MSGYTPRRRLGKPLGKGGSPATVGCSDSLRILWMISDFFVYPVLLIWQDMSNLAIGWTKGICDLEQNE